MTRSSPSECATATVSSPLRLRRTRRACRGRLAEYRAAGGRPNIVVILFDDVGWGDFGCYGGGWRSAPPRPTSTAWPGGGRSSPRATPSLPAPLARLAHDGRLRCATACCGPDVRPAGGLQGEVSSLAALRGRLRHPGRREVAHGRERRVPTQNVGFDDFYGFLSVSDMYTEWRDPYFFPEIVYSEERRSGWRTSPSTSASSTPRAEGRPRTSKR